MIGWTCHCNWVDNRGPRCGYCGRPKPRQRISFAEEQELRDALKAAEARADKADATLSALLSLKEGGGLASCADSAASVASQPDCSAAQSFAGIECHGLDTPERVCFYEQDFYVLSNFSSFEVLWSDSYSFKTAEHCYHWLRFATGAANGKLGGARPTDEAMAIADVVRRAPSAHEAFKIAQANKHLQREDWNDVKVEKMRLVIRTKALQHEYVRRKLLATGDRELVENSWRDDYWGWGPSRDGQNMLGKLWMELRAELRLAHDPAESSLSGRQGNTSAGNLPPADPNPPPPHPIGNGNE